MHLLYAAQNNIQVEQASEALAFHDIVFYTMRHHVHQFGMLNCRGQPCMSECYKIPMTVLITSGPHNIIGATMFIEETMNVALTGIHGLDTDSVGVRQARLDAEASSLAKMYNTISSYSDYPSISVCLESLGKVQSVNPSFMASLKALTIQVFSFVHRNVIPCGC